MVGLVCVCDFVSTKLMSLVFIRSLPSATNRQTHEQCIITVCSVSVADCVSDSWFFAVFVTLDNQKSFATFPCEWGHWAIIKSHRVRADLNKTCDVQPCTHLFCVIFVISRFLLLLLLVSLLIFFLYANNPVVVEYHMKRTFAFYDFVCFGVDLHISGWTTDCSRRSRHHTPIHAREQQQQLTETATDTEKKITNKINKYEMNICLWISLFVKQWSVRTGDFRAW